MTQQQQQHSVVAEQGGMARRIRSTEVGDIARQQRTAATTSSAPIAVVTICSTLSYRPLNASSSHPAMSSSLAHCVSDTNACPTDKHTHTRHHRQP